MSYVVTLIGIRKINNAPVMYRVVGFNKLAFSFSVPANEIIETYNNSENEDCLFPFNDFNDALELIELAREQMDSNIDNGVLHDTESIIKKEKDSLSYFVYQFPNYG